MTSLAMIAGMIPMALAFGRGSEETAPLGRAVIGGLLLATLATLFLLPMVFGIVQRKAFIGSRSLDPEDPESKWFDQHPRPPDETNTLCLRLLSTRSPRLQHLFPRWISGGESTPPPANAPASVSVVPVVSRKLHTTISLPAQLDPYDSVDIYPKVTGFVQAVTVDRGSRVRRGQVLLRLTAPEISSQRAQAEAAVRAAQSQLATAQAKLASDNGTYLHMVAASKTPGVLAENDVAVANQTVTGDQGVVAAAEQNIAAAKVLCAASARQTPI